MIGSHLLNGGGVGAEREGGNPLCRVLMEACRFAVFVVILRTLMGYLG